MTDKPISLFEKREKLAKEKADKQADPEFSFEEIEAHNKRLKERKAKERLEANKGVLRSYRIKH